MDGRGIWGGRCPLSHMRMTSFELVGYLQGSLRWNSNRISFNKFTKDGSSYFGTFHLLRTCFSAHILILATIAHLTWQYTHRGSSDPKKRLEIPKKKNNYDEEGQWYVSVNINTTSVMNQMHFKYREKPAETDNRWSHVTSFASPVSTDGGDDTRARKQWKWLLEMCSNYVLFKEKASPG